MVRFCGYHPRIPEETPSSYQIANNSTPNVRIVAIAAGVGEVRERSQLLADTVCYAVLHVDVVATDGCE